MKNRKHESLEMFLKKRPFWFSIICISFERVYAYVLEVAKDSEGPTSSSRLLSRNAISFADVSAV